MLSKVLNKFGIPTDIPSFIISKVEVAHMTKNRMRIVYKELKHDDSLYAKTLDALNSIKEIDSFEINRTTGSVLIHYKEDQIQPGSLLADLIHLAKQKYEAHKR